LRHSPEWLMRRLAYPAVGPSSPAPRPRHRRSRLPEARVAARMVATGPFSSSSLFPNERRPWGEDRQRLPPTRRPTTDLAPPSLDPTALRLDLARPKVEGPLWPCLGRCWLCPWRRLRPRAQGQRRIHKRQCPQGALCLGIRAEAATSGRGVGIGALVAGSGAHVMMVTPSFSGRGMLGVEGA
jgi:hypothetical protein